MSACTVNEWIETNGNYYDYYKSEYPFLSEFSLPLPFNQLKTFYIKDMKNRNLSIDENFLNCYDFVFSYFLENYPKPNSEKFQGRSFWELTKENLPGAIDKTISQDIPLLSPALQFIKTNVQNVGSISEGLSLIIKYWYLTIPLILAILFFLNLLLSKFGIRL